MNNRLTTPLFSIAFFTLLLAHAGTLLAATVSPTQWTRGDGPGATYQAWQTFVGAGPWAPDLADQNPNASASLSGTNSVTGNSFNPTSSGNIYTFTDPGNFSIDVPAYGLGTGHFTTVLLETRTHGMELDYSGIQLDSMPPSMTVELGRQTVDTTFGPATQVDTWYQWNLPASAGGAASHAITFSGADFHVSLVEVAVDTYTTNAGPVVEPSPIPEPASECLLLVGLAVAACLWVSRLWKPRAATGGGERNPQ